MNRDETIDEAYTAIQASVINWGKLLIATGGALKPEKYFHSLISFRWSKSGKWEYIRHNKDDAAVLYIPTPDGSLADIEHTAVNKSKNTLGAFTCPTDDGAGGITRMQEKVKMWLDRATSGHLH